MSGKELVAWGIKKGWVHLKPAPIVDKYSPLDHGQLIKGKRAKWKAQGLNWEGKPRKNKQHPELKGYVGKEYRKMYARLRRGKSLVDTSSNGD